MSKSFLTKEEIEKFKQRLLLEKSKIEKEIENLQANDPFSDPDHASDNAAVDTDVREEIGHENIVGQISELKINLNDINRALEKIEKETYGICELCKKPIEKSRLEFLPYARFCISCQKKVEG